MSATNETNPTTNGKEMTTMTNQTNPNGMQNDHQNGATLAPSLPEQVEAVLARGRDATSPSDVNAMFDALRALEAAHGGRGSLGPDAFPTAKAIATQARARLNVPEAPSFRAKLDATRDARHAFANVLQTAEAALRAGNASRAKPLVEDARAKLDAIVAQHAPFPLAREGERLARAEAALAGLPVHAPPVPAMEATPDAPLNARPRRGVRGRSFWARLRASDGARGEFRALVKAGEDAAAKGDWPRAAEWALEAKAKLASIEAGFGFGKGLPEEQAMLDALVARSAMDTLRRLEAFVDAPSPPQGPASPPR